MAGTRIGQLEFGVDADGAILENSLRRIGRTAGRTGGDAAGVSFVRAFASRVSREESQMQGPFRRIGRRIGDVFRRVGIGARNAITQFGQLHRTMERHESMWRRLSANTRQWTLIVGAVIASMSELAVLSSAAGSGLFVLAGGISGVVSSLLIGVWAFTAFSKKIEELPAEIRPARAAMTRFGNAWKAMGDILAVEVFRGTEGAWDSLTKTLNALTPALRSVGRIWNRLFRDFADAIAPGTKNFSNLMGFIEKSGPIFDRVVRSIGNVGSALLVAFNNPNFQRSVREMIGWIEDLGSTFSDFLRGPGFDEWLDHGRDVFGAFGSLLETTGELLNNLVTDESVRQLTDFFGNIERFLQTGGAGILDFAQKLDIFGLIAQFLADMGEALEPLAKPMAQFADGVNAVFEAGIDKLAIFVGDVATALGPFVAALGAIMLEDPEGIADALLILAGAFVVMKGVQGIAGLAGLLSGVIAQFETITTRAPAWKGALAGLTAGLLASLPSFVDGEVAGTDVSFGVAAGVLAGFQLGGPVGAAFALVSVLLATMIADLTNSVRGPWENGWDQLFGPGNYSGAGIGQMKKWFDELSITGMTGVALFVAGLGSALANGGQQIATFFSNYIKPPFVNGWNQIVTFFTVSIPQFFSQWNARNLAGFAGLGANVITAFTTVGNAFANGWRQITTFFTNAVPQFFNQAAANIRAGGGIIATAFRGALGAALAVVRGWVGEIAALIASVMNRIPALRNAFSSARAIGNAIPKTASGAVVLGPQRRIIGEAGPEAVVPLRRNLSQVDPSVRWLSAIAQGKLPGWGSGGVAGGGKQVTVAEGAIQVLEAGDSRRAANDVLTRLIEYAGS